MFLDVLPSLAIQDQGLLHAILAMGALKIAKLHGGPVTASFKHYAISLRRIGKTIRTSNGRTPLATLAAAQLLGYYEAYCVCTLFLFFTCPLSLFV